MDQLWKIRLLGRLMVDGAQQISRFRTQKTGSLLAYLALHCRPHPREELCYLLWPDHELESARNSLSTALWWFRQHLTTGDASHPPLLQADRTSVWLDSRQFTTDVQTFEAGLARAATLAGAARIDTLAAAVKEYDGPLLPGYYEDWVLVDQRRLAHRHLGALRELVTLLEAGADYQGAVEYALQAVRAEPLCEEAHRDLVRLYIASNQPALARQHYQRFAAFLHQELGVAPSPALQALLQPRSPAATGASAATKQNSPHNPPPAGKILSTAPVVVEVHAGLSGHALGGVVPLRSPLYVPRATDLQFHQAVEARESIILIQGPRDTGKTSLLARGLEAARSLGSQVVLTDLQKLNAEPLVSADALLRTLAAWIADQLELPISPEAGWSSNRAPSVNFERYLRRVALADPDRSVVWALDEADRLLNYPFGAEIFRLFRSWHNERALDPSGPWRRLTLVIAYAAEVRLFIPDLDQSPFNVGTRLELEDFTADQVAFLNQQYGTPLRNPEEVRRYLDLVGGNAYLVRRGLYEMTSRRLTLAGLDQVAHRIDGPFGERLAHLYSLLERDQELAATVRDVLRGAAPASDCFYRLRSSGILTGEGPSKARMRCRVYARYFQPRLHPPAAPRAVNGF